MKLFLQGTLAVTVFLFGCSKDADVVIDEPPSQQSANSAAASSRIASPPDPIIDAEREQAMLQNYLSSVMIYKDGRVIANEEGSEAAKNAALAQTILDTGGIPFAMGPGSW